jgi:hypothetical protein
MQNNAEAEDKNYNGGDSVSDLRVLYLRISARTAGECLNPILLPYSYSKLYPS